MKGPLDNVQMKDAPFFGRLPQGSNLVLCSGVSSPQSRRRPAGACHQEQEQEQEMKQEKEEMVGEGGPGWAAAGGQTPGQS